MWKLSESLWSFRDSLVSDVKLGNLNLACGEFTRMCMKLFVAALVQLLECSSLRL